MKVVICLFSFWLLLLTGLPCPDADCHIHETIAAATHDSHSADEHGHKAPCSPFCHCATCLGFSIPLSVKYILAPTPSAAPADQQLFAYQSPAPSDVASAIWQPPKL
jgi:hypothetical protein